jgi:hypothetical protein
MPALQSMMLESSLEIRTSVWYYWADKKIMGYSPIAFENALITGYEEDAHWKSENRRSRL